MVLNDSSTTSCTDVLKQVVAKCSTMVLLFCLFLDASKAFDLVRHAWHSIWVTQISWSPFSCSSPSLFLCIPHKIWLLGGEAGAFSTPFTVANGISQGSVLSPVLFFIYLDKLLKKLKLISWFWLLWSFCWCLAHACRQNALFFSHHVLLLCMRILLTNCESFGSCSGLQFNPLKTQLIRFHWVGFLSSQLIRFLSFTLNFNSVHGSILQFSNTTCPTSR